MKYTQPYRKYKHHKTNNTEKKQWVSNYWLTETDLKMLERINDSSKLLKHLRDALFWINEGEFVK